MKLTDNAGIDAWVIYDHPKDYPEHFVVRKLTGFPAGEILFGKVLLAKSLREARKLIPAGLFRFERHPEDDDVIVETWL